MASLSCRLLPFARADGPHNMAADELLLQTAYQGRASLRFYGWAAATVSLGYFQPHQCRFADPLLASLPWVRRPTGGKTLVHHHELTYALALPAGAPWHGGEPWLPRMHHIIAAALRALGVMDLALVTDQPRRLGPILCFQDHTPGDLLCGQAKVVGSAQRKSRHCLLQHGGILLARSPHAPALAGVRDLSKLTLAAEVVQQAVVAEWTRQTDGEVVSEPWSPTDLKDIDDLVKYKYGLVSWNEKR